MYQNLNYTQYKHSFHILGEQPSPAGSKIHIKSGYVLRENKKVWEVPIAGHCCPISRKMNDL